MAQTLDQAKQERELSKASLARNLDRLESHVRAELDWKARLRRDGARYAVIGGVVLAGAIGIFALRRTVAGPKKKTQAAEANAPQVETVSDLARELQALRSAVEAGGGGKDSNSSAMLQKLAMRVATTAATAAGTAIAKAVMERNAAAEPSAPERSRGY